jgi:AcrR family transcriptional regulator
MAGDMSRWEPNARGRLQEAAMELYAERGFDATTVAEIAARAGLTERTFFRHFADKREVLFSGADRLEAFLVERVLAAPDATPPLDAIAAALEAASGMFDERRPFARQRHALIVAHAELRERELIKLASLGAALADALHRRGVPCSTASLAAEAGIAVFKVAYGGWVDDSRQRALARHVRKALAELKAVAGATAKR